METLAGVARGNPQTDYAGLQYFLQQEWIFVQGITSRVGEAFRLVEEVNQHLLLPSIFQGATTSAPEIDVTYTLVKQSGLALPDTNISTSEHWIA